MSAWILTCDFESFNVMGPRFDGHELQCLAVDASSYEPLPGDRFVLWLTGPWDGVIAQGRITGHPAIGLLADAAYWKKDPGQRRYVPVEIDEWLDHLIPRNQLAEALAGTSITMRPRAFDLHPVDESQWSLLMGALRKPRGEDPGWHLQPGETISRKELHQRYGGSTQDGISPSAQSPNVLIFTDPSSGRQHGYYDEWAEDGTFHYTGQGQKGDQDFSGKNSALRDHAVKGRRLRLFDGSKGIVRYVGEMTLDPGKPCSVSEAPATNGGALRKVLQFHMIPVGVTRQVTQVPVGDDYRPVDEDVVPVVMTPGTPDPDLMGRNLKTHRRLQNALAQEVTRRGMEALSPTVMDPAFDLAWRDPDGNLSVCEVKSLTEANEVRQLRAGLGQVLDYHDILRPQATKVQAVLWIERAPSDPRWVPLCQRVGVTLAWPGEEDRLFRVAAVDTDDWPHSSPQPDPTP